MNYKVRYISKTALAQYWIICLIIYAHSSILSYIYKDVFIIVSLLTSAWYILKYNNRIREIQNKFLSRNTILLGVALILTVLVTYGNLSINSVFNILSSFFLILAAILIDRKKFIIRFVKTVVFFAGISIIIYILCEIGFSNIYSSISHYNGNLSGYQMESSYGLILYHLLGNNPRNIGIFMEPGVYQIVLNTALFLLLFRCHNLAVRKKLKYLVVLIITNITAMSTAGYFTTLIIILTYLLKKQSDYKERRLKKLILSLILVLLILSMVLGFNEVIYKVIFSKILNSSGKIDLTISTGYARIASLGTDFKMILHNPLGYGFDQYGLLWKSFNTYDVFDTSSVVGLTGFACSCGVVSAIIILRFYFKGMLKFSTSIMERICSVLLFFIYTCTQPILWFPSLIILAITGHVSFEDTNKIL